MQEPAPYGFTITIIDICEDADRIGLMKYLKHLTNMTLAEVVEIVKNNKLPFTVFRWNGLVPLPGDEPSGRNDTCFYPNELDVLVETLEELGAIIDIKELYHDNPLDYSELIVRTGPFIYSATAAP